MLQTVLRLLRAFCISVLVASISGCIFSTHFVLEGLIGLGIHIPLSERVFMTLFDLGMIRVLGILTMCCFFIAFIVAAVCHQYLPMGRSFWYSLGGASSILVLLMSMNLIVGGMPVAGARTISGFLFQGLAGALGGWLFAKLSQKPSAEVVVSNPVL